jgi:glycosyltransferase involved in cell wall biosynthesis
MKQKLSLSVIVPVYNERTLVEASLRRLLVLKDCALISFVQVIVVDDGSSDGSAAVLERCRRSFASRRGKFRWVFLRQEPNQGKGAAFRKGLGHAQGDVTIIHDADLEYFPEDIPAILLPFLKTEADAVYGSRFLPSRFRAVMRYRHELLNRMVTFCCDWVTNYNLTDSATCYKAVRTSLLKSIPLSEDDFRFEPELTVKLAKRGARLFEVPISYAGRSVQEGKKLGLGDGFRALAAYFKHSFSDDIFSGDDPEANLFARLNRATRYQRWMLEKISPWVGQEVLELGAKTGHLTAWLLPRARFWACDPHAHYLESLKSLARNKPYLNVAYCDPEDPQSYPKGATALDTVICINTLASARDPQQAVACMARRLKQGGQIVLVEPRGAWLFGALDHALGSRQRFSPAELEALLRQAGLEVVAGFGLNRFGSIPWWLNSVVLKRRRFGLLQVVLADWLTPLLEPFDAILPFPAMTQVAVGRKGA